MGRRLLVFLCIMLLAASGARAQVQTGSITGVVADTSGALLPGATVKLPGEKLIGGAQTQITDYVRCNPIHRLPPGVYLVKFELQGFRVVSGVTSG